MSTSAKGDACLLPQVISVAIPRPVDSLFTYKLPAHFLIRAKVGNWVKVPFGKSVTHAYIVEPPGSTDQIPAGILFENLREVIEVGEGESLLSEEVLSLCRWARDYYFAPLGEVLNCAAPFSIIQSRPQKPRKTRKVAVFSKEVQRTLTSDQEEALKKLESYRRSPEGKVALLQGVTGSGKTEVYIELAKATLAEGKSVLILVPEIALTPQLHDRFESSLDVPVAQWHSAVSAGLRREQALAIREGKIRVVVGARSSVFAPMENLGLIIVDEEHDPSFKQEDRVKYHARDLAVVRGKLARALVVLGSATPSLETRERVLEGRYGLAQLPRSISSFGLPSVELVDLRTELKVKNLQAPFAEKTLKAIQETIDAGNQVILYLNRRGYAAFLLCTDCGEVRECPQCSVSLTVHKKSVRLKCHQCGYQEKIPEVCKKCGGFNLQGMGAGTESLESQIPTVIQNAKILRLDRDLITSTKRLVKVLDDFKSGAANILLGTQMLAKGHDFSNVTLVVVVMADALFRWPDFRASERAYQILKQVGGRAGRGEKAGKVIIQSFDTEHSVLQALTGKISESDFLESERQLRRFLNYPPFGRIARLRFESLSKETGIIRSKAVSHEIQKRSISGLEVLGPSEAFLERVKGAYRWDILLKSKKIQELQRAIFLAKEFCALQKWQFSVDIDPYGI